MWPLVKHVAILSLLLAASAVLAGCSASDPAGESAPIPHRGASLAAGTFAFGEPMVAATDCRNCYEPSVAWAFGHLYATSGNGANLTRYDGSSWQPVAPPPLPAGVGGEGDVFLQVDAQGRLWWSGLILGVDDDPDGRAMRVARSDDGITWALNTQVDGGPLGQAAGDYADRQWLAFLDGAVYASCNCPVATRTSVQVSHDDGATWEDLGQVTVDIGRPGPAGIPAGHGDTLVMPFLTGVAPHPARAIQGLGVGGAVSTDGGVSWSRVDLGGGLAPTMCCAFPAAAAAPDGTFLFTWTGIDGNIVVAHGQDPANVQRTVWNPDTGNGVYPHPWVAGDSWGVAAAWFEMDDDTQVHAAVGTTDGPEATFELASIGTSNSDFAHLALGPRGEVAVTWSEPGTVWVAIGQ